MTKGTKTIIILVVVILIIVGGYLFSKKSSDKENIDNEETVSHKLVDIIKNSHYFDSSNIVFDKENNKLSIDERYEVHIKSGYYMMNVKDEKDEDIYCQIVDSVIMDFGNKKGSALDTCKRTLDGSINMGGINVEFLGTYKVLTVNSEEKSNLYSEENTHISGDFISLDEINYNVQIEKYLLTSLSTGYSDEIDTLSICGNIFHPKGTHKTFEIKIYDADKNIISVNEYNFQNEENIYKPFCTDFIIEENNVKYYSIS